MGAFLLQQRFPCRGKCTVTFPRVGNVFYNLTAQKYGLLGFYKHVVL